MKMENNYKNAKILIVEDEPQINRLIELVLQSDGYYKIKKAYDGKECFDIILFQIKSIDKLVNDILYLSETEVAKTNDKKCFEIFDLNSMIETLISCFNYANIEINFTQNIKTKIYGSKEALETAISNLITNAIKYSASEKIDIIIGGNEKNIELIIKDYGIGIAKEHLNHIFEKFYRIDKNHERINAI